MKLFDNAFWNAIVTAVISAIVTNVCLWWHKKADYKRDYYKKIVDKRIVAYEKLAEVIADIGIKTHYAGDVESGEVYICFSNFKKLDNANKKIVVLLGEVNWFSPEIFSEIRNLNNILANVLDNVSKDYLNGKKWTFINYLEAENNVHSIMEKTIFRIKKLSIDDRMHLDDVEGFFKEQKEQINK